MTGAGHAPAATAPAAGVSRAHRLAAGAREFVKFAVVGGSGVAVNLVVFFLANKGLENGLGLHASDAVMQLGPTRFSARWYHVLSTLAFLVANTWNYQLNRSWTFRHTVQRSWLRGFVPFLATGVVAFLVSLTCMTLLMNPASPVALPEHIFDDSTGLRTKSYWAQAISTLVAMPVNFVINKLWAFGKPKVVPVAGF